MTREHALHTDTSTRRPHRGAGAVQEPYPGSNALVLIQVPEVKRGIRSARRPSEAAVHRVRRHTPARGRRRLRREVRVVATALAAIVPLLMAAALLRHATPGGERPGENSRDARGAVLGVLRAPSVSLSIEAPGLSPKPETQAPVSLPGYLLPDDGEDPAHAGG